MYNKVTILKGELQLKNLMIKEFTTLIAGYEFPRILLFNADHISEEEVDELIRTGRCENSNDVVLLTKEQYKNLCK